MNKQIKLYFLLLFLQPVLSFANTDENKDYWTCKAHDDNNGEWVVKNNYQKVALNLAFDACKKQSKSPLSCKTSNNDCEGFHLGFTTKPYWRCTALDRNAGTWKSNYYPNKDDAYMAAKAYCKSKSKTPETCYVHSLTCVNVNENSAEQK